MNIPPSDTGSKKRDAVDRIAVPTSGIDSWALPSGSAIGAIGPPYSPLPPLSLRGITVGLLWSNKLALNQFANKPTLNVVGTLLTIVMNKLRNAVNDAPNKVALNVTANKQALNMTGEGP